MGVKVCEIKCSFWCECDIRGTNGTKREKYGEKYSGVNAANDYKHCTSTAEVVTKCIATSLRKVILRIIADQIMLEFRLHIKLRSYY